MKYFEGQKVIDNDGKIWEIITFRSACIWLKRDDVHKLCMFSSGNPEVELEEDGYKPLKMGINFI